MLTQVHSYVFMGERKIMERLLMVCSTSCEHRYRDLHYLILGVFSRCFANLGTLMLDVAPLLEFFNN